MVFRTLHLRHTPRQVRIDWWGAVALVVALVPLLTVAEQGREWGWDSARSITAYVVGGLGLIAFYLAERAMGDAALIPLRLFRIRAAAITILASVAIGAAMFGGILILPLYMQIVHGASPTMAGLLMLPMVLGMMTGAMVSGNIIARTGRTRVFPRVGSALLVIGLLLLSTTSADTSLLVIDLFMLVLGVGLGNCMQPLLLIMQSAVPPSEIGVATSSATFFRQIGGTLGVAVFLSILFSTVGGNIADEFEKAAQTPAFQAGRRQPDSSRRRDPERRPGGGRRRSRTTRRSSRRCPRRWRTPSSRGSPRRWTRLPDGSRSRADRLPAPAVHAEGRAARHLGRGRSTRRGGRGPRRADGSGGLSATHQYGERASERLRLRRQVAVDHEKVRGQASSETPGHVAEAEVVRRVGRCGGKRVRDRVSGGHELQRPPARRRRAAWSGLRRRRCR